MRKFNKDIPLEQCAIHFPEQALKSPEIKAKLVTFMRFLLDLSSEIQDFTGKFPDIATLKSRQLRTPEDALYFLDIRNQSSDFIRGIKAKIEIYWGKALGNTKEKLSSETYEQIDQCIEDYLKKELRPLKALNKASKVLLYVLHDASAPLEDELVQDRSSFHDRMKELIF